MLPTSEQIEVAAYHLWERRDRAHGHDREDWETAEKELIYRLSYEPIEKHSLAEPVPRVVAQEAMRRCRFCERSSRQARFGPPAAVIPIVPNSSLLTAEICEDCQAECRDPLLDDVATFWESLRSDGGRREHHTQLPGNRGFTLGAYKSLVASALLMLPDRELPYFLDAIEWAANPNRDVDQRLFTGLSCRTYSLGDMDREPWFSLARRIDDDARVPYMLAFISWHGHIVQIHVPLCSRDEDLDGRFYTPPERSFAVGHGWCFRHATSTVLPLVLPGDLGRSQPRRSLIEC
jgi:hypothetical protein